MLSDTQDTGIAITTVDRVLVVTMQPDLDDGQLHQLSCLLGARVTAEKPVAVVLDFSTVALLSFREFKRIHSMLLALRLLGARVAMSNLCSEIVIYLTELDVKYPEINFFQSLQNAVQHYTVDGGHRHGG